MTSVLDYKVSTYRKQTSHPFEKPVDLSEHIVKAYSNGGDLILDPYSGSGNICIALKNCGRNFIGVEIDQKYYTESIKNLDKSGEIVEDKIDKFLM
jgi:DNA modification methylase